MLVYCVIGVGLVFICCSPIDYTLFIGLLSKVDPHNGMLELNLESVFEVVVDGKVHRIAGKGLQR